MVQDSGMNDLANVNFDFVSLCQRGSRMSPSKTDMMNVKEESTWRGSIIIVRVF